MRGRFEPLVECQGHDGYGCVGEPPSRVEQGKFCSSCVEARRKEKRRQRDREEAAT